MWLRALREAANQVDGGGRSFPPSVDSRMSASYRYSPPTEAYEKLLCDLQQNHQPSQEEVQATETRQLKSRSAGWVFPTAGSPACAPVIVAHSIKAALWLIRESLPAGVVDESAWQDLVNAANALEEDAPKANEEELEHVPPPSGQKRAGTPFEFGTPLEPDTPEPASKRARTCSPAADDAEASAAEAAAVLADLACTPRLSAPPISPAPTPPKATEPKAAEPTTTTVTNNNRRAEQNREKKREQAQEKRRVKIGLVPPPPNATRRERSAYASIERDDEASLSWLLKQETDTKTGANLFESVPTPYVKASTMLEKARSVGNETSRASAAAFLRSWRTHGTPFAYDSGTASGSAADDRSGPLRIASQAWASQTQDAPVSGRSVSVLASAWDLCDRYEQELDVMHIRYRWAMAFLGKEYVEKMDEIRAAEGDGGKKNRHGKGKVSSEAMNAIIGTLTATAPSGPQRQRFKRRLHQAVRWHSAVKQLGWGILCLMPHDVVTNSWVENDLRIGQWEVWLSLVGKVRPEACQASWLLESWLGSEGIAGGSIGEKEFLALEKTSMASPPPTSTQVTEVPDSDDEDESGSEGGDLEDGEEGGRRGRRGRAADSQATAGSENTAPPEKVLRQMTLMELVRPFVQTSGE